MPAPAFRAANPCFKKHAICTLLVVIQPSQSAVRALLIAAAWPPFAVKPQTSLTIGVPLGHVLRGQCLDQYRASPCSVSTVADSGEGGHARRDSGERRKQAREDNGGRNDAPRELRISDDLVCRARQRQVQTKKHVNRLRKVQIRLEATNI